MDMVAAPMLPGWLAVAAFAAAALLSFVAIPLISPWLAHYAMARPGPRSSHREPTPQGGGMAVVGAMVVVAGIIALILEDDWPTTYVVQLAAVVSGALVLAIMGAVDDIRSLDPWTRLALQVAAVGLIVAVLPPDMRIIPTLPAWVERAALLLIGVWFVNLVNFMDGIDWMVVAEVVPASIGLILIGLLGGLPAHAMVMACALLGAMIGFAPFNRPVARLFLGDVGSIPIGLVLGWLLLLLAARGHVVAAILLPLYFVADATITLLRRAWRLERLWEAHRQHFYQRAVDRGVSVPAVIGQVFTANLALVALAAASVAYPGAIVQGVALAAGIGVVALLLLRLARASA